jgi:hypothetical protein
LDFEEEFLLPDEIAEWIGLKKSEYLSQLIMVMENDDFGFEEFTKFDKYIPETIQTPDKLYQFVEDGYPIQIYLKAGQDPVFNFQVVIGMVMPEKNTDGQIFVPIISFVTRKEKVLEEFVKGDLVKKPLYS